MTPRQLHLFRFVREKIERTGEAPSYAEMQEEMEAVSTSQIHHLLSRLVEQNKLLRVPGLRRGLRLVESPARAAAYAIEDGALVERFRLTQAGWDRA